MRTENPGVGGSIPSLPTTSLIILSVSSATLTPSTGLPPPADFAVTLLWHRLLGRPASESGRLCHGDGGHEWGDRRLRAFVLTILLLPRVELVAQQQAAIERVSMESVVFALRSKGTTPCPHCGGRLRLIATLHDPAVIRKILAHLGLAHSGQSPGPAPPSPAPPRPDRLLDGAASAVVPASRDAIGAEHYIWAGERGYIRVLASCLTR
jgi:hypothetical protein